MEARDDAGAAAVFASERAGAGSELSVLCHVFLYHARHFSDDAVRARKPGPLLYGAAAGDKARDGPGAVPARFERGGAAGAGMRSVHAPARQLRLCQKCRRYRGERRISGFISGAAGSF